MEEIEATNNDLRDKISVISKEIRVLREESEKIRRKCSKADDIASEALLQIEILVGNVSAIPRGGGKQAPKVQVERVPVMETVAEDDVARTDALKIQLSDLIAIKLGLKEENKTLRDQSDRADNLKSLISKLLGDVADEIKALLENRSVPPVTNEDEHAEEDVYTDDDEPIPKLRINDTYRGRYVNHQRGGGA